MTYSINIPAGYFTGKYPDLKGSDWIRRIDPEDREALIRCGMERWEYGRMGGIARSLTARRDSRGRFVGG